MKLKAPCVPALICALLAVGGLSAASAETLQIPTIENQPPNSPQGVHRPVRAMTMEQVRAEFGEPVEIIPAVGDPPITRWVYDRFIVHFEHQYVIHSVVKK